MLPLISRLIAKGKHRLTLCGQLILVTSLLSALASILTGVFVYQLQSRALYERAGDLIAGRARQAAASIAEYFEELRESALFLAADDRVQAYLISADGADGSTELLDEAYSALSSTVSLRGNLLYAYIVNDKNAKLIYVGPPKANLSLEEDGVFPGAEGGVKLTGPLKNPLSEDGGYVFLAWQEIFDIYQVRKKLGSLCLATPEHVIARDYLTNTGNDALALSMVNGEGRIVSDPDSERVATTLNWVRGYKADRFAAMDGNLTVLAPVSGTDFYVAGSISELALTADSAYIITLVGLIIIGSIAACVLSSIFMSRRITAPFRKLIERMARVSVGDFESPIDLSRYGGEYERMADGYNAMIEEIGKLMHSVREKERLLAESELKMLKAQINPHFLYNTLDSIHWLAAMNGQREICTMVKALADFYRVCLGNARERIPLGDELKHACSYLTIQKIRYSDVLESSVTASPEDMDLPVPSMILQPLIENAIYHGLKGNPRMGTISIREYREADALVIEVSDDGRGMSEEKVEALNRAVRAGQSDNHGIINVHRRVVLICGQEYGLYFSKNEGTGLRVTVRLPLLPGEGETHVRGVNR